tara:strand:- start:4321 stop:5268 length:948 start_codon:yes stop_codon:yes gene_type:complete
MVIKDIFLPRICSDDELKTLKGTFLDDEWILHTINYDVNIYDEDTGKLVASFRKNRLKEHKNNFQYFKHLANPSRGRGASAGPIDPQSHYWKKRSLIKTQGFRTGYLKKNGEPSKMNVNNQVLSTAIGYYNSINSLGIQLPCRLSHYTSTNMESYTSCIPFIDEISRWYQKVNPVAYQYQLDRAQLKDNFRISKTPFSTITVNRNFRTGLHKDSGDYGGVACLSVLEHGEYNGGVFMLPAYGIGIDMRGGDILCADVHQFHCNSEIWTTPDQDERNKQLKKEFNQNSTVGTVGAYEDYSRISLVCYLREAMIDCN